MLIFSALLKPFRMQTVVARAREQIEHDKREIYNTDHQLEQLTFHKAMLDQRIKRLSALIASESPAVVRSVQTPPDPL